MHISQYEIDGSKAVLNKGNLYRIQKVMRRAMCGEHITVGFIGGSITQGCLASSYETCYAYLVYQWWCQKFSNAQIAYVNAGIGGTTSQFGVARADKDLLSYDVDVVVVEFSVNDLDNAHFCETYEGLIRKVYGYKTEPAILIVNSVCYDDGVNAQTQHVRIGKAYEIPCISMKPTLYEKMLEGAYTNRDITADGLHPNDEGHGLMAEIITHFLDEVYEELLMGKREKEPPVKVNEISAITDNAYENSIRYQNTDRMVVVENDGFVPDLRPQEDIREIFRCGWTADQKGARICFEIEGTCIGVQYRKSVLQPTAIAQAVIDGDASKAVILDGNFDQTWGDSLYLETLAEHLSYKKHCVEIELIETHVNDQVPFYLVSVIGSGTKNNSVDGKNVRF